MPFMRQQMLARLQTDHAYLAELAGRIENSCTQGTGTSNCDKCEALPHLVCHRNIGDLVGSLIEATTRHHLFEFVLMNEFLPKNLRIAHLQAHISLTDQMTRTRRVLARDGNCVSAIDEVSDVLVLLTRHATEYDRELEDQLLGQPQ